MKKPSQRFVPVTSTAFALALSLTLVNSAQAAEEESADSKRETVVVTATRSGETLLQDTPIAVTALSANDLDERNIHALEDIYQFTPGLNFSENAGLGQVYVRGIGTNLEFAGSDPSTSIHWDGVYLARPGMVFMDFIDVERVEVLRGPQGTLYGRNSTGGTINIISRLPRNKTEGRIGLEIGSYDLYRVSGQYMQPIVEDELAIGVGFFGGQRDGYVNNVSEIGPEKLNNEANFGLQTTVNWFGHDTMDWVFRADMSRSDDHGLAYHPTLVNEEGVSREALITPTGVQVDNSDPFTLGIDYRPSLVVENAGFSATGDFDLSDTISLKSISAYREMDFISTFDSDFTLVDARISNLTEEQSQISQEFTVTVDYDQFQFLSGLFYFSEDHEGRFAADFIYPAGYTGDVRTDLEVETEVLSLFFRGTFVVNEQLSLWAGARYNDEEKKIKGNIFRDVTVFVPTTMEFNTTIGDMDIDRSAKEDWSSFNPSIGLSYEWNDDVTIYGSINDGFKSGGFNFTADEAPFDEETVLAYEIGMKSLFWDDRVSSSIALFYYDYEDLQVRTFVSEGEGVGTTPIRNASEASVSGFEYEGILRPTDNLKIFLSYSYLDATYDDYVSARTLTPSVSVDLKDNYLNSAPQEKYNATIQYTQYMEKGDLTYTTSYFYQDDTFYTAFNDDVTKQEEYYLIDASIRYSCNDGKTDYTLYGKNLTDEAYFNSVQTFSPLGVVRSINPPRTVGLKMNYYF